MDDKTILLGKGDVTINQILDQKEAANDLSDYLFYMTRSFFDVYVLFFCFNTLFIILLEVYLVNFFLFNSINLKKDDPVWSYNMTLRVKSSGQILHAFVNGELIGEKKKILVIKSYIFLFLFILNSNYNVDKFIYLLVIGSQWSKNGGESFVFEQNVKLNHKKNTISLLSATVGFTVKINPNF